MIFIRTQVLSSNTLYKYSTQFLILFVLQIVTDENHPSTDCATVPRWIEVHQRQKREYQGEPSLRVTDNQDGNDDIINDNDDFVSENNDKKVKNDDKAFSHLLLVLAALSLHSVRLSRVLRGSLRCRRARLGTKPGESISLPVSLRFPRLTCRLVLCSDSCCTSPDSWLSCWRGCGPLPPALCTCNPRSDPGSPSSPPCPCSPPPCAGPGAARPSGS